MRFSSRFDFFIILHGLCAIGQHQDSIDKDGLTAGPLGEYTHYSIHQPLIATRYLITLKATNF